MNDAPNHTPHGYVGGLPKWPSRQMGRFSTAKHIPHPISKSSNDARTNHVHFQHPHGTASKLAGRNNSTIGNDMKSELNARADMFSHNTGNTPPRRTTQGTQQRTLSNPTELKPFT